MLLGATCGCVRAKVTYYINPDGSGKVTFNVITVDIPTFGPDRSPRKPPQAMADRPGYDLEEKVRLRITRMLQEAKGFSAWKIDKCEFLDDGQLHMIATAWFEDVSKIEGILAGNVRPSLAPQQDGTLKVEFVQEPAKLGPPPGHIDRYAEMNVQQLTDQQLADLIRVKRVEYQAFRGTLAGMQNLKVRYVAVLPGEVVSSNLTNVEGNTLTMDIAGDYLLQILDQQVNRDISAVAAEVRKTGKLPTLRPMPSDLFALLGKTPTAIVRTNLKPHFDYAVEVQAARKAYPQLIERFKLGDIQIPGGP
jgi:hypothetical protein